MLPKIEELMLRRKKLNLTQKQLSLISGVSQSIIAKIESNKVNPSYQIIKRIHDVLENLENKNEVKAGKIMNKKIIHINKNDKIIKAIELMRKFGFSQLPVFNKTRSIGSISEKTILNLISTGKDLKELSNEKIDSILDENFPTISEDTPLSAVSSLLQYNSAILVTKKDKTIGIITKSDLLKLPNKL